MEGVRGAATAQRQTLTGSSGESRPSSAGGTTENAVVKRRRYGRDSAEGANIRAFPAHIIVRIFEYVFSSAIPELWPPALLSVCRLWRRLALGTSHLWANSTVFVLDRAFICANPEWDFVIPLKTNSSSDIPSLTRFRQSASSRILNDCRFRSCSNIKRAATWTEDLEEVSTFLLALEENSSSLEALTLHFDRKSSARDLSQSDLSQSEEDYEDVGRTRQDLWNIVNQCVTLHTINLRMPNPTRVRTEDAEWLPLSLPRRQLETFVILDSDYSKHHWPHVVPTSRNEDASAYWSALASGVRICNLATVTDQPALHAILEVISDSVEVLLIRASSFTTFFKTQGLSTSPFKNLRRLCLHQHIWPDVFDRALDLPLLEELEGDLLDICGFTSVRLLHLTIWIGNDADGLKMLGRFERWLHDLRSVRHLTLIASLHEIVGSVCLALSAPGSKTQAPSALDDEAEELFDLACPKLRTLTLILHANKKLVAKYCSPGHRFLQELWQDYKDQRDTQERLVNLVQRRASYMAHHLEKSENNAEGKQHRTDATLHRLTIRRCWCYNEELSELRIAYSSKMTELRPPATSVPEGAAVHGEDYGQCLYDIVPRAADTFRYFEWKRAVQASLECGLVSGLLNGV
ncbi:unnamed protein product [Parajaminaea phylloscopi]